MAVLRLSRYARIFKNDNTWWLFHGSTGIVARLSEDFVRTPHFHELYKTRTVKLPASNPVVQQMHELGILMDEEEYQSECQRIVHHLTNHLYDNSTLELVILPTEQCNFRCVYCYEDFSKGAMDVSIRNGIKNLVSRRAQDGIRTLSISWFGGEPLLQIDIILELGTFFLHIVEEYDIDYNAHITTNGYFLSRDVFESLCALGINSYQVTIDGPPDIHNRRRRLRGGEGTFEHIWNNLISIHESSKNFVILLRCNVDQYNCSAIDMWLNWVANSFVKYDSRFRMHFHPVFHTHPWKRRIICDDTEVLLHLYRKAQALGLQTDMASWLAPGNLICYAARASSLTVGSDGTLYKCTVAFDMPENQVGTLLPDGSLQLNEYFHLWTHIYQDSVCLNCGIFPQCGGVRCPLLRLHGRRPCPHGIKAVDKWVPYLDPDNLKKGGASP